MKKLLIAVLAIALLIVPMGISVSAAPAINEFEKNILDALDEDVKVNGKVLQIPEEYIIQAENYFKTIDVTEAQSVTAIAKIEEGKNLIKDRITVTSDLKVLPYNIKKQILDNGKAAAAAVGATLTYTGSHVEIVDNATGSLVFDDKPIIKVTGAGVDYTVLIVSGISLIAVLAAVAVIAHKKRMFVK